MLTRLNRKRMTKYLKLPGSQPRRRGAKARPLKVEPLESRDLLTVAPFVGPLPITSAAPTPLSAAASSATSQNSAAPTLSAAQVAAEATAGQ
jgi:hypothetical protein